MSDSESPLPQMAAQQRERLSNQVAESINQASTPRPGDAPPGPLTEQAFKTVLGQVFNRASAENIFGFDLFVSWMGEGFILANVTAPSRDMLRSVFVDMMVPSLIDVWQQRGGYATRANPDTVVAYVPAYQVEEMRKELALALSTLRDVRNYLTLRLDSAQKAEASTPPPTRNPRFVGEDSRYAPTPNRPDALTLGKTPPRQYFGDEGGQPATASGADGRLSIGGVSSGG